MSWATVKLCIESTSGSEFGSLCAEDAQENRSLDISSGADGLGGDCEVDELSSLESESSQVRTSLWVQSEVDQSDDGDSV